MHVKGRSKLNSDILNMSMPQVSMSPNNVPSAFSFGVSTPNVGKRSPVNEFVCASNGRVTPDICDIGGPPKRGDRLRCFCAANALLISFSSMRNDGKSNSCCLSIWARGRKRNEKLNTRENWLRFCVPTADTVDRRREHTQETHRERTRNNNVKTNQTVNILWQHLHFNYKFQNRRENANKSNPRFHSQSLATIIATSASPRYAVLKFFVERFVFLLRQIGARMPTKTASCGELSRMLRIWRKMVLSLRPRSLNS